MTKAIARKKSASPAAGDYSGFVGSIDAARRASVRTVNAFVQTPSAQSSAPPISSTVSAKSGVAEICSTPSSIFQTASGKSAPFALADLARAFPLPWSHCILLISRSRAPEAFAFCHTEALVRYATDALPNKMLVREYLTALPDEKTLADELKKNRKQLEVRK